MDFDKVPLASGLGIKVKQGSYGAFGYVETVIGMHKNCNLYLNRSKSGDTFENSLLFTELKEVPTDFDCEHESRVRLEVILDHNSVEAFFFDWYSLTALVFTDPRNRGIELFTELSDSYIRVL